MRVKDAVGRFGEQRAAEHLAAAGLEILDRNWRCRTGELDIVAREGSQLVFIEVKTRSSLAFGAPAEAVDRVKSARIRELALRWIMAQREAGAQMFWETLRFDVVSVVRGREGIEIAHLKGAF
ncbi:MAG TPA: YraN family protein [Jatrophihabitans sp.]|jgi:putative endonuclease|nr:YraN family protein [Jatrophihabitans sp.]